MGGTVESDTGAGVGDVPTIAEPSGMMGKFTPNNLPVNPPVLLWRPI